MSAEAHTLVDTWDMFDMWLLCCLGSNCQGLFCSGNPEASSVRKRRLDCDLPKILFITIACCRYMGTVARWCDSWFILRLDLLHCSIRRNPHDDGTIASSFPGSREREQAPRIEAGRSSVRTGKRRAGAHRRILRAI